MLRRIVHAVACAVLLIAISSIPTPDNLAIATVSAAEEEGWRNLLIDPETGKAHCHEEDDDCHAD